MDVKIEQFSVDMQVKNSYIKFQVRKPLRGQPNKGEFLGSLHLNKTELVWCQGKTRRENGKAIAWEDFIAFIENQ